MNPEVLELFNKAIDHCDKFHGVHFARKIRHIDTTSMPQNEVNFEVTKEILTTLDDMIKEKIAYFDVSVLRDVKTKVFRPDVIFGKIKKLSFNERNSVENQDAIVQPIP